MTGVWFSCFHVVDYLWRYLCERPMWKGWWCRDQHMKSCVVIIKHTNSKIKANSCYINWTIIEVCIVSCQLSSWHKNKKTLALHYNRGVLVHFELQLVEPFKPLSSEIISREIYIYIWKPLLVRWNSIILTLTVLFCVYGYLVDVTIYNKKVKL